MVHTVHIGKNIARARKFRDISPLDMATKLGVSQQVYNGYEKKAKLSENVVEQIAEILDVPIDFFTQSTIDDKSQTVIQQNGNKGAGFYYNINAMEEIKHLYSEINKEKDNQIKLLKEQNQLLQRLLLKGASN